MIPQMNEQFGIMMHHSVSRKNVGGISSSMKQFTNNSNDNVIQQKLREFKRNENDRTPSNEA